MFLPTKLVIKDIENRDVICIINMQQLHSYITKFVGMEFSNLIEACYYPKVNSIYQDLLHMCNTDEKKLIVYSHKKYGKTRDSFKLVHDPYTTLLILIIQKALEFKDLACAEMTFHLFALRTYSNTLRNFTTPKGGGNNRKSICIKDVFETAMQELNGNHIFKVKKTIPSSIIYFSSYVFNKYKKDIEEDNSDQIFSMIYSLKNRIKQSIRSFMHRYYDIYKSKTQNTTAEEDQNNRAKEIQLREYINRITTDMCIYRRRNNSAYEMALRITKFNKKISQDYIKAMMQPSTKDLIDSAYYILLRDVTDTSVIKQNKFLDYIKTLMSIKTTKQILYFKKIIDDIQLKVIKDLRLEEWYNGLTIQSKAVGRNFIAYYLALYLRYYV